MEPNTWVSIGTDRPHEMFMTGLVDLVCETWDSVADGFTLQRVTDCKWSFAYREFQFPDGRPLIPFGFRPVYAMKIDLSVLTVASKA